jgi:hypothetical protein
MTTTDRPPIASSGLARRQFIQLLLAGTVGLWGSEALFPKIALANIPSSSNTSNSELYHVFISDKLAQSGGEQPVTFKSGKTQPLKIPTGSREGVQLSVKQAALDAGDATVILHTLYDPSLDIDAAIDSALAAAPLIAGTRDRCLSAYRQIKAGTWVVDVHAQDVLDIVISGSPELEKNANGELIRDRYRLASQNCRLLALQNHIDKIVSASSLLDDEKLRLKGIYQYVRANESLPSPEDFDDLTAVDAIVQNSGLPLALKQRYAIASAQTRAFTVDEVIMTLIRESDYVGEAQQKYLTVYNQARLGQVVEDQYTLGSLDSLVYFSDISPECKTIYKLARNQFFKQDEGVVEADLQQYLNTGKKATRLASNFIPTLTQVFGATGVTAGTGTAISSLTGAAATNATLAALGGGSVAAGGLGMLGGLAVATGGAALVGAAALVSVSLVAGMDGTELKNLGIAATTGTFASAAVVGTAWAAVSTFGAAGSLSGAAAVSSAMAAMGGIGVMTGGAAVVAFGVGLGVWQFLESKDAMPKMIRQAEPLLYTVMDQAEHPLIATFKHYLGGYQEEGEEIYIAPEIPLDKLANVLFDFAPVDRDEKILALVDMSIWKDGKGGIAFTDSGIWWKHMLVSQSVQYSDPDYLFKIKHLPEASSKDKKHQVYDLAVKLGINSVMAGENTENLS